jgi:hypothetical protein
MGHLTEEDAQDLYSLVTGTAGWRPIATIDDSEVLDRLIEIYGDRDGLAACATAAAYEVAYERDEGIAARAERETLVRAIGIAVVYAAEGGLVPLDAGDAAREIA